MFYSIRHLTQFRYSAPVSESLMELRMHPRTEGPQRCLSFQLSVDPRVRMNEYRDYLGNTIHHFDVPGKHGQLRIVTESLVELQGVPEPPDKLTPGDWTRLDELVAAGDYWEMLMPSAFAQPTEALQKLGRELGVERREDPLTFLLELSRAIREWFEYVPKATRVDSPIDHAIETRKGVCQDFAHIMTALVRSVRMPCRYVSGYLHYSKLDEYRSADGASHAWIEALLPGLGWVGVDPTNDLLAGERHIRTAIGRDYADVPPTKGVFKGNAASELTVAVRVAPSDAPLAPEIEIGMQSQNWSDADEADPEEAQRQQQQQQQQ
jgi:transglutaminase-like putative cysteine protease